MKKMSVRIEIIAEYKDVPAIIEMIEKSGKAEYARLDALYEID